ncbi:MAG: long-chain fatty acid--CoA ligase [Deltaproteobacteria bacterium]|nr:long-chain fatty acid--CoA ligase [Deltaproteobacteria bacterium]
MPVPQDGEGVARLLGVLAAGGLPCVGGKLELVANAPWTPPGAALAVATSGSTGAPRWAALSRGGIEYVAERIVGTLGLRTGESLFCPLPLRHTYGLSQLWACLRARATLVLPRLPLIGRDWEAARDAGVLAAIPAQVEGILAAGLRPRALTLAGQATPVSTRRRLDAALPMTEKHVFYGLTEATSRVLALPPGEFLSRPEAAGRPLPGTALRLVDGELCVQGPQVFLGYLDCPGSALVGWLPTGDAFVENDGLYRFVGRRDSMVKRFGEKVFPEQVEQAIGALPGVREVHVVAEGETLVARVVGEAEDAEIRRAVRLRLGGVAVPDRVDRPAALVRTAAGKLPRGVAGAAS